MLEPNTIIRYLKKRVRILECENEALIQELQNEIRIRKFREDALNKFYKETDVIFNKMFPEDKEDKLELEVLGYQIQKMREQDTQPSQQEAAK